MLNVKLERKMVQNKNGCMITGNPNSFNFCLTSILLSASSILFLRAVAKLTPACTGDILFAEVFCYTVKRSYHVIHCGNCASGHVV